MKKMMVLLMTVLLVLGFGLTACGNTNSDNDSTAGDSQTQGSAQTSNTTEASGASGVDSDTTTSASSDDTAATGGKTLVVYYSASGNTERVANYLAEATGADLFEIVPTQPYTDADLNWMNSNSRVSREHDDESLRDVPLETTEVADWDSYDTVFIGYPIWWGIAAWPVDSFVKENDFTGKTVIPFATSASSGMGQSGRLLEEMAGTGTWQSGERFSSGASAQMVSDWVEKLNLNQ